MCAFAVNEDFTRLYPDASPTATECAMNLVFASDLVQSRIARLVRPFDLTPASGLVLSILADAEGPLPPNQIAEQLIVSRATVTGLVDSLERRKYVKRKPHPSDRRMLLVQITPSGRAVADESRAVVHAHERRWFDVLDQEEQVLMKNLLGRVQERLQQPERS